MVQDAIVLGIVYWHVDHLYAALFETGLHQWHEFAYALKAMPRRTVTLRVHYEVGVVEVESKVRKTEAC